jgi:hypothetical protein
MAGFRSSRLPDSRRQLPQMMPCPCVQNLAQLIFVDPMVILCQSRFDRRPTLCPSFLYDREHYSHNLILCDQRLFILCQPLECHRIGQMSTILEDRSAARQDFLFKGRIGPCKTDR